MDTIVLPKRLNKESIREVVIKFRDYVTNSEIGSEVQIDMRRIEFTEPSGMVSLSNIIKWAEKNKKIEVTFIVDTETENVKNREVMNYLSDCGFFKNFGQEDIFKKPSLRITTLTLKQVETSKINQWQQSDLMIWLQHQTGRRNDFSSICVAIDEIFNNISDHSTEKIGCIFGQHYPKKNEIIISVSDFGVGIPTTIREKFNGNLSDDKLIEYALQEGVSSQSVPQNRGAGLSNIMNTLTKNEVSRVTILSNCGMIEIFNNEIVKSKSFSESYPGTFFELVIDVSNEHLYDLEEEEEFSW